MRCRFLESKDARGVRGARVTWRPSAFDGGLQPAWSVVEYTRIAEAPFGVAEVAAAPAAWWRDDGDGGPDRGSALQGSVMLEEEAERESDAERLASVLVGELVRGAAATAERTRWRLCSHGWYDGNDSGATGFVSYECVGSRCQVYSHGPI